MAAIFSMKVGETKEKIYQLKKYLYIIKPYLSDIINDHKTRGLVRYHSGNKSWLEETSSEWKIQFNNGN